MLRVHPRRRVTYPVSPCHHGKTMGSNAGPKTGTHGLMRVLVTASAPATQGSPAYPLSTARGVP